VVCVDQRGRYAVSLLSGHLGGANDLAREVAKITAGRAVIGTATDLENVPAADVLARERGLAVADPAAIKAVNLELLAGETVQVLDPDNHLGLAGGDPEIARRFRLLADPDEWREAAAGIVVDHRAGPHPTGALLLHPPVLAAGVGCRKGASAGEIVSALREVLAEHRLAEASLVSMGSAAAKAVEPGLLEAAGILGCGLYFFEAGELARMSVPNPSDRVMREMGTPSVSEAAAMLLADSRELLVEKTVKGAVTCALAVVS
jgi:cobalt-precorrin 5A hydrolase